MSKFKVLDLFCGAGGFSYGLSLNDEFEIVVANDFDEYATETYKYNHPSTEVILGDITKEEIKSKLTVASNNKGVNVVIGGPPCQGFSLKGKNLGIEDERNFLFLEFMDIVKRVEPEIFIIENVKNMVQAADGYFINQITKLFGDMGYSINSTILNSKFYGVPQSRERAIILGSKNSIIGFPDKLDHEVTVKDAIEDLAFLASGEGADVMDYKFKAKSPYQKRMRINSSKIYNHVATNHSKLALEKLMMIPPEGDKSSLPIELHGRQKFKTTWSRLKWISQSPTIDTRFDTPSNGRNSHPELHRAITAREAARLQSFPDDFIFKGTKTAITRQIGNAVPPLLAYEIGKKIIEDYEDPEVRELGDNINMAKIINANAYTYINELIRDGIKVDHIITDPPYNISKENNFSTMNGNRTGIVFGNWDFDFDLYSWIKSYKKILSKDGSIIIFCSYRNLSHYIDELERNDFVTKDVIVWKKSNPMPRNINRRYVQDMEFAIWAVVKGAKWVFNKPTDQPYARSLFTTSTVAGKERTEHPTQKSLSLFQELIEIHTDENQIILDPFMGSGTTGAASLSKNRGFIGIELSKDYYNIAADRISRLKKTSNI